MRIAVAIEYFDAPNGAATYAHVVAGHLQRLGHTVAVVTTAAGAMAELAQDGGLLVTDDLAEPPDVVLAQDPMIAVDLAARWRETPQVYVAHGATTDQGMPPALEGITSAAIAMNDRVAARLEGFAMPIRIVRLRQPIDVERFRRRGPSAPRARRVLLLGNYLQDARRDAIVAACAEAGLEAFQVGEHGDPSVTPEEDIARADVVIGYGRVVLEAMSCGRAAYLLEDWSADGWVTPARYPAMEADGFAGTAFDETHGPGVLARELADYDPAMGEANRALVLRHHQAAEHAAALARLAAEVVAAPPRPRELPADAAALVRAQWSAQWRYRRATAQLAAADARATEHRLRAEALKRRVAELEALRASRRVRLAEALARPLDRLRRR